MSVPTDSDAVHEVDFGLLEGLVGFNLRLGYNRATHLFSQAFAELDLAPIQFAALEFISRNVGCSQKAIAEHIGTAPPTLVGPLERLERRGVIDRSRGEPDRRVASVSLTPEGEDFLAAARQRVREVDDVLVEKLSGQERKTLLKLLHKIRNSKHDSKSR